MSHVPSIKELRKLTQEAKSYRTDWQYIIHRRLSIYITWILLHTKVSANQVTVLSLLTGVVSAGMVLSESVIINLAGLFGFYGYFLLDKVDGEIARFRKSESFHGIFLDYVGHLVIPALLPVSIGASVAGTLDSYIMGFVGGIAALACMFLRSVRDVPLSIMQRKYLDQSESLRSTIMTSLASEVIKHAPEKRGRGKKPLRVIINMFAFSSYLWTIVLLLFLARGAVYINEEFYSIYVFVFITACFIQILDSTRALRDIYINLETIMRGVKEKMKTVTVES